MTDEEKILAAIARIERRLDDIESVLRTLNVSQRRLRKKQEREIKKSGDPLPRLPQAERIVHAPG
jgi:hypothetical protein